MDEQPVIYILPEGFCEDDLHHPDYVRELVSAVLPIVVQNNHLSARATAGGCGRSGENLI